MTTSYRPGIAIVALTLLLAFSLCLARVETQPARAARDLGENAFPLGSFRLKERSGRTVTDADLADRVWIASFIFTRCPLSCPRITSVMKGLQGNRKLAGSGVQLVSLSVDPRHDTPEVLADYAAKFSADSERWWFLTGPSAEVTELIHDRFKLPIQKSSPGDQALGAEAFEHSDRLALVDRGNRVVGYFESTDAGALAALVEQAKRRSSPAWVRRLPAVNATLNTTCAVLLLAGWTLIRAGRTSKDRLTQDNEMLFSDWSLIRATRIRAHAVCMIAAVTVSTLFLTSYLVYHYHAGSVPFRGAGPIRLVYFTILLSHTVLAVTMVPLVVLTLVRAGRRDWARHARIARVTFPIWLYVSVTGVVIYVMLYQLPV